MNFNKKQKRYLQNKSLGYQIIKGELNTGKTTCALYKTIKIENKYCILNRDEIAFISSTKEKLDKAKEIYFKAKDETFFDSLTLFSTKRDKIKFFTLDEIINSYSNGYINKNRLNYKFIDQRKKICLIKNLIEDKKDLYKKSKVIKNSNLKFLIEEIDWIRENNLTEESYLNIPRMGRGKRLKKGALTRIGIYDICKSYEEILLNKGFLDYNILIKFAFLESEKKENKFSHVIVDDFEEITKTEFQLLDKICSHESYSTLTIILNSKKGTKNKKWIPKNNRTFIFDEKINIKDNDETLNFLENYTYYDLKNKTKTNLLIDYGIREKEVIIKDFKDNSEYVESDLKSIPIYSNIAAGEPILINSQKESEFSLPSIWFKGKNNIFILTIKGDSMKNADIEDGDLVVIKKQNVADNNEIVAVNLEGEATLKRLILKNGQALLMPENPKYLPISLEERQWQILGVAIGIIKQK
ncbi:LexA family protein [Clostridium fallax]|uniref:SOS regulatory protein LexA n=1 Tax=Clostridium fallax TaxID=1533 RepID=A0A1M4VCP2_9CLOT|nr:LexA family transcriptional regulator [Clostridium fallax]SHE66638.1 SOS regulatory protein LexA [Clostridium fallax]SQB05784.1 LexA repressor [Clostridium fallax]